MAEIDEYSSPADERTAHPVHNFTDSDDSDGSDEQFQDAQSAPISPKIGVSSSPIPKTRVERVDHSPAHGEVRGTDAFNVRRGDAEPDEVAVIGDQDDDDSESSRNGVIASPDMDEAPRGDCAQRNGSSFRPDEEMEPDDEDSVLHDVSKSPPAVASTSGHSRRKSSRSLRLSPKVEQAEAAYDAEEDFGDDFDDFEEGAEDEDFDNFEDGFQQEHPSASQTPAPPPIQALPFPIPDFDGLSPDEVTDATEPYINRLFPPEELDLPSFPPVSKDSSVFLTPRSASLWSQLVAPPPLAPPDWIRSRTRRLFLVSLGVPVDLDEILPASKQKKLVLPSLNFSSASPRTSTDSRSMSRLRTGEGNGSSTSVDTQGKPTGSKRRRGAPPPPELDLVAARHMCKTTDEALDGMTAEELQAHVTQLESMQGTAKELLEYWQKRTDEKIGDRETFEGVIENLVRHARKTRK